MIDLERARAETPGCARVVHLNNAGASLAPIPVLETTIEYLRREAEVGGYELAIRSSAELDAVYESTGRFIGAEPGEIAMFDSATRAWNLAVGAIVFEPGDRILVSRAEYASSALALLQLAERMDVGIELVPDDEHGQLDVDALGDMLDERVRLVAVTHVPTSGGLVNPVAAVGKVVADTDAFYLVDACQSVGQLAVDVDEIGCDFLSATGRKFLRAPRGTGFLYARRAAAERVLPPFMDLRGAAWVGVDRYEPAPGTRRFEMWERNVAAMLGFGAAVEYALGWGIDSIEARVRALAETLRARLVCIDGLTLRDQGSDPCGIVTFTIEDHDPKTLAAALREERINVWHSTIASARIDFESRSLESVVRASVHYFNNDTELDRLIGAIAART